MPIISCSITISWQVIILKTKTKIKFSDPTILKNFELLLSLNHYIQGPYFMILLATQLETSHYSLLSCDYSISDSIFQPALRCSGPKGVQESKKKQKKNCQLLELCRQVQLAITRKYNILLIKGSQLNHNRSVSDW